MEELNNKISDDVGSTSGLTEMPLEKNNFGLSKDKFETLSNALKVGDEELFETIFLSHFQDCKIYIMKKHDISKEVAYDITMDTLIDFRKLIIQGKINYGNLRFLFTRIASQKFIRSNKNAHRIDLKQFYNIEEYQDREDLFDILTLAWGSLNKETQKILEAYFYNKTPMVKLAKNMGKSDAYVRKKKQRGIEKIRSIFFKELKNKSHAE